VLPANRSAIAGGAHGAPESFTTTRRGIAMRSTWKTLAAAVATALVAPQLANADDVEERLRQMQERMDQLEDQLAATNDQLDASTARVEEQQRVIERAELDDRSAASSLTRFLEMTEISGFIAASWNYNFHNPDASALGRQAPGGIASPADTVNGWNSGALGLTAPLHSNPNSFQVDQLWFSLAKPVSEESRGGWGADIVFGAAADAANGWIWGWDDPANVGSLPHLFQAYVAYLAPLGRGIEIRAGRWESLLGAESFRQDRNFSITRGLVWSLQPVNHTGVLFSGDLGESFGWALGVANQSGNTMAETDNSKTGVGQIKWYGDTTSLALSGMIGGDVPVPLPGAGNPGRSGVGRDADYVGIVDLVATWDPTDELSAWVNFDAIFTHGDGLPENTVYAVAVAGHLVITEATGFSLRGEYVYGDDVFTGSPVVAGDPDYPGLPTFAGARDIELFSITGTFDHRLAENLTLRLEGRYDVANLDGVTDMFFVAGEDPDDLPTIYRKQDQVLGLVEILYEF
jgi:hypothetical protein